MRFQNFIPRADHTTVLLPETQTKRTLQNSAYMWNSKSNPTSYNKIKSAIEHKNLQEEHYTIIITSETKYYLCWPSTI